MSTIAAVPEVATTGSSSAHTVSPQCSSHRPAEVDAVAALAHDLRNFMHCVQMSVCVLKTVHAGDDGLSGTLDVLDAIRSRPSPGSMI